MEHKPQDASAASQPASSEDSKQFKCTPQQKYRNKVTSLIAVLQKMVCKQRQAGRQGSGRRKRSTRTSRNEVLHTSVELIRKIYQDEAALSVYNQTHGRKSLAASFQPPPQHPQHSSQPFPVACQQPFRADVVPASHGLPASHAFRGPSYPPSPFPAEDGTDGYDVPSDTECMGARGHGRNLSETPTDSCAFGHVSAWVPRAGQQHSCSYSGDSVGLVKDEVHKSDLQWEFYGAQNNTSQAAISCEASFDAPQALGASWSMEFGHSKVANKDHQEYNIMQVIAAM